MVKQRLKERVCRIGVRLPARDALLLKRICESHREDLSTSFAELSVLSSRSCRSFLRLTERRSESRRLVRPNYEAFNIATYTPPGRVHHKGAHRNDEQHPRVSETINSLVNISCATSSIHSLTVSQKHRPMWPCGLNSTAFCKVDQGH